MKNIVSKIILLAFVVTMFGSCSESLYDEKFVDPSKSATVDFGNLMVGTNLYSREWAMSGYGRYASSWRTVKNDCFVQIYGVALCRNGRKRKDRVFWAKS